MSIGVLVEKWVKMLPAGLKMVGQREVDEAPWPELMKLWVEIGVSYWIRKALKVPDIPLADMQSEVVRSSWEDYRRSVCDQWGLPMEQARPLLEELLEDLLNLMAQPSKQIPDLLFDTSQRLGREELSARLDRLVVHHDLGRALVRYAERKGVDPIDRSLAQRVLEQVDQKLVEHYDEESWAAQLQPLFELWAGPVPSRRVRALLSGRGAAGAHRIPNELDPVSLEWVLKQLHSEPGDGEDPVATSPTDSEPSGENEMPDREASAAEETDEMRPPARSGARFEKPSSEPRSLSEMFGSKAGVEEEEPEPEAEENDQDALHQKFQFDEPDLSRYLEERERTESAAESREGPLRVDVESREVQPPEKSIETPSEREEVSSEEATPDSEDGSTIADEESMSEPLLYLPDEDEVDDEEGDENAIWKNFLGADDTGDDGERSGTDEAFPEEEHKADEPGESTTGEQRDEVGESEPTVRWLDPSGTEPVNRAEDTVRELEKWLEADLDRFQREIFDGSEAGLQEALRDLARMEQWGDAARYLQEDVFDRYRIDLFDDAAVDLTDRMQAWFEEENPAGP